MSCGFLVLVARLYAANSVVAYTPLVSPGDGQCALRERAHSLADDDSSSVTEQSDDRRVDGWLRILAQR